MACDPEEDSFAKHGPIFPGMNQKGQMPSRTMQSWEGLPVSEAWWTSSLLQGGPPASSLAGAQVHKQKQGPPGLWHGGDAWTEPVEGDLAFLSGANVAYPTASSLEGLVLNTVAPWMEE